MANYNTLKTAIANVIKTNGNNEITGQLLQNELLSMITTLGYGYQFVGIATPTTAPGTPDAKVFYIAYTPGTYTNFGGIAVTGLCVLKYATSWVKEDIPVSGGFTVETTDLTLVSGTPNKLKFADRIVEDNITTGKNYVILRSDSSFESQITVSNTIYEIRYDFDLDGNSVTIPENCVLFFNGGSILNGSIVYNKTFLCGNVKILANFSASNSLLNGGYITNNDIFASWFGVVGGGTTDDSDAMQRAIDHVNNNMVNLHIDKNEILLTKTLNFQPLTPSLPYSIIGHTKNNPTFRVNESNFSGTVVLNINNTTGACVFSDICVAISNANGTLTAFKIATTRNSKFSRIASYRAHIGLQILSATSYCDFEDCRFDNGDIGVQLDGSFNSNFFDGLHCGGNSLYAFYSTTQSSPTNIIVNNPVFEQNKYHIYLNSGIFVFNDAYIADNSDVCVVNNGANVTFNGVGNGVGIASAGSGDWKPSDNTTETNNIIISGGETKFNNVPIFDGNSPVGETFTKNSNGVKHTGGIVVFNNCDRGDLRYSNNLIKSENRHLIRFIQKTKNFALDGVNFSCGINYNIYKSHSTRYAITQEPTISFVPKINGVGNTMRVTLPICTSKIIGFCVPVTYPAELIGGYANVRIRFNYVATETNAQMVANGHNGIRLSTLRTKSWVTSDQTQATLNSFGLKRRYLSTESNDGYNYLLVNNSTDGTVNKICTVANQESCFDFPVKVQEKNDFIVILFGFVAMTLTEELAIDFEEISVFDAKEQGRFIEPINGELDFSFPTDQRPTFDSPANAVGFKMYDSTLNKIIRFDGTNWLDLSGSIV